MKKYGFVTTGLICGLLLSLGIQTFAADTVRYVTASVNETFQFIVNGEKKELPEDYELLVYNNRSYLPVRAASEMMGSEIFWNEKDQTININSEKHICDRIDTTASGKLPQSIETLDYKITAQILRKDEKAGTRIYLKLENKTESVLRLDQDSVVFEKEGRKYPYSTVSSLNYDNRWYSGHLEKDDEMEGYLRFPEEIEGSSDIKIHLNLTLDGQKEQIPVTFYLKKC